ncbi:MAG: dUTP diphosphatase [Paludibacteraceae bacterium]|nr:dUTP diphosphatase [Paludibacteraceae bacterium]
MEIRFKKTDEKAVTPRVATKGSAGYDLTAVSKAKDDRGYWCYGTGIAAEIPDGYVGLVFPRSSISRYGLELSNCVGVIDSDYRGEITAKFRPSWMGGQVYDIGDRICQLVIVPVLTPTFVEVEELTDTERGTGGYGSTGK